MGQLLLEDVVLDVLGAVEGVLHLAICNFKLALQGEGALRVALGGVVEGGTQLKVVEHAGHRGAPVDDVELLLVTEGVKPDVIGVCELLPLGAEVDAGEIGRGFCLLQPVPVHHRRGAPVVDLPHKHAGLEHLLGVALTVGAGYVFLCLPVLFVHSLHRELGLFQLCVDHFQNVRQVGKLLRWDGLLRLFFLFH